MRKLPKQSRQAAFRQMALLLSLRCNDATRLELGFTAQKTGAGRNPQYKTLNRKEEKPALDRVAISVWSCHSKCIFDQAKVHPLLEEN